MCAVIANSHRTKGKKFRPKDFMPRYGSRRQTPEQMLKILEGVTKATGGEDKRNG